jgi:hypothetical protein
MPYLNVEGKGPTIPLGEVILLIRLVGPGMPVCLHIKYRIALVADLRVRVLC